MAANFTIWPECWLTWFEWFFLAVSIHSRSRCSISTIIGFLLLLLIQFKLKSVGATLPCFFIFIESCHYSLDQSLMEAWISFLLPLFRSSAAAKSFQSCPTLCDPIDGSPPGSPVPGILQARTLEWVAIAFSDLLLAANFTFSVTTFCFSPAVDLFL